MQIGNDLLYVLVFFIPGFISLKVYHLLMPSEKHDFSKNLLEVICYSALNYAGLSWLIYISFQFDWYSNSLLFTAFMLFTLLIMPFFWPIIIRKLFTFRWLTDKIINPIPTPWDYLFLKRDAYWVIVHLTDGKKIAGMYDTNSYVTTYPEEKEIYLEQVWKLDRNGGFEKPVDRSAGTIILSKNISSIEFFS